MKYKKPMIGILPLVDTEKESYWMLPGYMDGIIAAGGIPVMLPLTDDSEISDRLAHEYDGFLFTGGHDISPSIYGEETLPQCAECSPERDGFETALLDRVLMLDKPILGICRGIQLLNAVLGGTLYQDLPTQYSSKLEHHQSPPYDIPIHNVKIEKDSPLFELLGTETLAVNSYHHQAIKQLSPKLCVMAKADDGLVEAVCMPGKKYVRAVQWHPEFSYKTDSAGIKIFEDFVTAARV